MSKKKDSKKFVSGKKAVPEVKAKHVKWEDNIKEAMDAVNENPDIGYVNDDPFYVGQYAAKANTITWKHKYFNNYQLKRYSVGLYAAALPFIFGIIVNLTGDYLTASVVTSSLLLGPLAYNKASMY